MFFYFNIVFNSMESIVYQAEKIHFNTVHIIYKQIIYHLFYFFKKKPYHRSRKEKIINKETNKVEGA